MTSRRTETEQVMSDNEQALTAALDADNYVQAFLLAHTLTESLLRSFLNQMDEHISFNNLIRRYQEYLEQQHYPFPTFIDELTKFNQRRNRIVHQLWRKAFTATNKQAESAATAAVFVYNLLNEWLELIDPEITEDDFDDHEEV
jgi:hypothetical protein